MATIPQTSAPTNTSKAYIAKWANVANGDVCASSASAQYADKSVQVFGTFGSSGQVAIEGSNDGVNWAGLTDPQANALVFTGAKIEMVSEATMYIRPVVTGDGATSLTVLILMKE
jgi:hypothetical protein